jgi:hypothetical protein
VVHREEVFERIRAEKDQELAEELQTGRSPPAATDPRFGAGPVHSTPRAVYGVKSQVGTAVGLLLFGVHLVLLGYLVYRSGYIPRVIDVLLAIDGSAWVVVNLQPFFYPNAELDFLFVA